MRLNIAKDPSYMNIPGWDLHPLTGNLAGHYSIGVNGNWRMTFTFEGVMPCLLTIKITTRRK